VRREGREKREKEREICKLSVQIELYVFILIYQETQFCGRSPRERVNHVYIVVSVD
jgi:hypothetical protein